MMNVKKWLRGLSQNTKEYLQNPNFNYSEGSLIIDDFSKFKFLDSSQTIHLSTFDVKCTLLGGHSKSDMSIKIQDDIFVGDILIGRDIGRLDLYGGDKNQMIASLAFFLEEDFKTMHSGHGQDSTKQQQDNVIKLWLRFLKR